MSIRYKQILLFEQLVLLTSKLPVKKQIIKQNVKTTKKKKNLQNDTKELFASLSTFSL